MFRSSILRNDYIQVCHFQNLNYNDHYSKLRVKYFRFVGKHKFNSEIYSHKIILTLNEKIVK